MLVGILVFSNMIYTFIAIPVKIRASYFVDSDKRILKFIWRSQRHGIAKDILKKNKVGGLTLLDFKTYYKTTVVKTEWYW